MKYTLGILDEETEQIETIEAIFEDEHANFDLLSLDPRSINLVSNMAHIQSEKYSISADTNQLNNSV